MKRLFPGEQHRARFRVREDDGRFEVAFTSVDGRAHVDVAASAASDLASSSVFSSMADASAFFRNGSLGYSATGSAVRFDGLELCCATWKIEPLIVERVESSFFDDQERFPPGTAALDSAFFMGGIPVLWKQRSPLFRAGSVPTAVGPTCA